jgi:hypothetical protein
MKNFLRTSLYLTVFALAGILFQISCSADSNSTNSTSVGKLIYLKNMFDGAGNRIYTCNYDGTNETLINVTLPSGIVIDLNTPDDMMLRISPDGQKVFFVALDTTTANKILYSCDISGANPAQVIALNGTGNFRLGGAY